MKIQIQQGDRYGRITIIEETLSSITPCGTIRRRYLCECDCGKIWSVGMSDLLNGDTKSCGCLRDERRNTPRHGKCDSRIYQIWKNMKGRCLSPKRSEFKNYGGRGIKVCDKWLSFEGFWEDMKEGYSDRLTIERIDNNGNYCKENCKWISKKEQNNNQRTNILLTFNKRTQTLSQWVEELGLKYSTTYARFKRGCLVEKILIKNYNT